MFSGSGHVLFARVYHLACAAVTSYHGCAKVVAGNAGGEFNAGRDFNLAHATTLERLESDSVAVSILAVNQIKARFTPAETFRLRIFRKAPDRLDGTALLVCARKRPIRKRDELPRLIRLLALHVSFPQFQTD
ncbi:hypothetical protein D3C87_1613610 [compost metagenome]